MDWKTTLGPVSKAVAGALVALLVSLLAQFDIRLGGEEKSAIELLINGLVVSLIGAAVVYLAPKNREGK